MAELGLPIGAAAVARHYEDILDVFIADEADANEIENLGIPVSLARTLMSTIEDREALARVVLAVADRGA
jgi:LPPG:FO 2-phospho-L-lactate transferase